MGDQYKIAFALFLALGATAVSLAFLGGRYLQILPQDLPEKSRAFDLARDASDLNKTLPEMVSEGVRLDRTSVGPGKLFNYFYTLLDDEQARAIASDPSRVRKIIAQLNERVCVMMPNYVRNGVVVKYYLKNPLVADLPTVVVDPHDCRPNRNIRR